MDTLSLKKKSLAVAKIICAMLLILSVLGISAASAYDAPASPYAIEPEVEYVAPNYHLFPNFRYDPEDLTFRIPRSHGFSLDTDRAVHTELYHRRQYILSLPANNLWHLGYGEVTIDDDFFHSVTITPGFPRGYITLTFQARRFFVFDVTVDEYYYIIRAMNPRERYPFIVVIDPGHGGWLPGAVHGGVRESNLNLEVTRLLLELIEQDGYIRAYTTRNSDVHVSLLARARFANEVGDLFLSIHHNAANNRAIHGLETFYFMRPHGDCLRHANRDDCCEDYCEDYDGRYDDIFAGSQNFANAMRRQLLGQLGSHNRGSHSRRFVVLRDARIPATLVELGFMSNADELSRMRTEEFQRQAAQALYDGLLEAFALNPPVR